MKKLTSLCLLVVALSTVFMQSCKLERVEPQCPQVDSISPKAGHFDDLILVKGKNFIVNSPQLYSVSIGGKSVSQFEVLNANTVRFKVPKGIGSGAVNVSLAGGTGCTANAINFIYKLTVTEIKPIVITGLKRPAGMDVDASGNVIVADRDNNNIKLVTPIGSMSVIAGLSNNSFGKLNNDAGDHVQFYAPEDVAVDKAGNIYVADYGNSCIRMIANNPTHYVNTAAGKIDSAGDKDGKPVDARYRDVRGVAVYGDNNLVTVEYNYNRFRYINFSASTVSTVLGGSTALNLPVRIAYSNKRDPQFPVLIADWNHSRIVEANINGTSNPNPILLSFKPQDLATDESGNIIVLNNSLVGKAVSVVYPDRSIENIVVSTDAYTIKSLSGLAIDTKNKFIYFSDDVAGSIVRVKYE